jgi:hypothetical protein
MSKLANHGLHLCPSQGVKFFWFDVLIHRVFQKKKFAGTLVLEEKVAPLLSPIFALMDTFKIQ